MAGDQVNASRKIEKGEIKHLKRLTKVVNMAGKRLQVFRAKLSLERYSTEVSTTMGKGRTQRTSRIFRTKKRKAGPAKKVQRAANREIRAGLETRNV